MNTKILLILMGIFLNYSLSAQNSKADQVINRYVKITGLDKLQNVPNYTYMLETKMLIYIGDKVHILENTIIAQPSTQKYYSKSEGMSNSTTIINGDKGWSISETSGINSLSTATEASKKLIKSIHNNIDWVAMGSTSSLYFNKEYIKREKIGEHTYNILKITNKILGIPSICYFEDKSGLLAYTICNINGQETKTIIQDYLQFGEVLIGSPIRILTEDKQTCYAETINFVWNYPIDNIDYSDMPYRNKIDAYSEYRKGLELGGKGKFKEALIYLDKAISIRPNYIEAHMQRIRMNMTLQEYDQMIKNCNTLLGICPDNCDAYYYRALGYYCKSDYKSATSDCQTILSYDTNNETAKKFLENIRNTEKELQEITKEQKGERINNILGYIQNGLVISTSLLSNLNALNTPAYQNSRNGIGSYSSGQSSARTRQECPACGGSGKNKDLFDRPAFYDHTDPSFEATPCSICGRITSHIHKNCSQCRGIGYIYK